MKDGKVFRITFSKSLAEHLLRCGPQGLHIERVAFQVGRRLQHGEQSASGLYAITSTREKDHGLVLRITLSAGVAKMLTPDHWREIRECWLV